MKERKSYIGKLNGISGVWCDQKPEGLEVEKEITFYSPDEGKMLCKDGEMFESIVIDENTKIEDYTEVDAPRRHEDLPPMEESPAEDVSVEETEEQQEE